MAEVTLSLPEQEPEKKSEKPQGPTAIIVRGPNGGLREALKGADGKFVKKERKLARTRDVQEVAAEFLTTKFKMGLDGKMEKKSKTRLVEMLESMFKLVTDDSNPITAAARVKAFEQLRLTAWGKDPISEKDRSALEYSGIKFVVLERPELMHPEVVEEKPKPVLKPSFADQPQVIEPEYIIENPHK